MSESLNYPQNELLQQLKQRLKKTKSESPVAANDFAETKKVEPSVAAVTKTDAKLKKVIHIFHSLNIFLAGRTQLLALVISEVISSAREHLQVVVNDNAF